MVVKERKHDQQSNRPRKRQLHLSDLVIPMLSFVIFVLVLAFLLIPMISEASSLREEIDETKGKQATLTTLISNMSQMDTVTLDADYRAMNKVIPARIEVADFALYVDLIALKHDLELVEIHASNNTVDTDRSVNGQISSVNGPVSYLGTYDDILEFIDDVQTNSKYIISISNLQIVKEPTVIDGKIVDTDTWQIDLVLSCYYVSNKDAILPSIYSPYSSYTNINEKLLTILRQKAAATITTQ